MEQVKGRARGGVARAEKLTPERRREIAMNAAQARKQLASLPKATHTGTLKVGDLEISCAVLPDGTRVLSQRGVGRALGRGYGGKDWKSQEDGPETGGGNLPFFLSANTLKPFISNELLPLVTSPIMYRHGQGGGAAMGVPAVALPPICDVWLKARDAGVLSKPQRVVAQKAEVLMRGLAHVGVVALVDEATGYQKDRARDALAQILEAFVAKELQPYVRTFDPRYYEELFRLRGLKYPPDNPRFRPQYFGVLTNDIVYSRLAPGVLQELKAHAKKDEKKAHLHRRLTQDVGHPKLKEHLASVITAMRLSTDYQDFIGKMNQVHPRFGDTYRLALDEGDR